MLTNNLWTIEKTSEMQSTVRLQSWTGFGSYIRTLHAFGGYVWRGQRDASWPLQSSFDRLFDSTASNASRQLLAERHLGNFKLATRGRRGSGLVPSVEDEEWWALAQHNSMKTPLLDWSEAPFIALYFAFEGGSNQNVPERAVWALSTDYQDSEVAELAAQKRFGKTRTSATPEALVFIRPLHDGNSRLVAQAGLFTQVPLGNSIEDWISKYPDRQANRPSLLKIVIPERDSDRTDCLGELERMNINHLTLFPDLYGAGTWCNDLLAKELTKKK